MIIKMDVFLKHEWNMNAPPPDNNKVQIGFF